MTKTYIIDTSAIVQDPYIYRCFENCEVVIPITVLNELDSVKKHAGSAGRSARVAIKLIDDISNIGDISTGVLLENNVLLKIDATYYDPKIPEYFGFGDPTYGDTQILICAYVYWRINNDTTLVSNDINLRIKAKSRGIEAISQEAEGLRIYDIYSGNRTITCSEAGLELQQAGYLDPRAYGFNLNSQECILFENEDHIPIALGRKTSIDKIKLIKKQYPWGIKDRNKEQAFAIDLITDKNIDLVTLIGRSGAGKTVVALAAALELVLSKKQYNKLIIYRPVQAVGAEIGFLPGSESEKIAPWFQAILDNFENLFSVKDNNNDWKRTLEMYQKKGLIEFNVMTYIRGRSISNTLMLFDEAQNLTREDTKTILTRAGEGSKIILTGDIEQIDNSSLDATNNGLTYAVEKFKNLDLAGHITFTQGERSRLATKASEIL